MSIYDQTHAGSRFLRSNPRHTPVFYDQAHDIYAEAHTPFEAPVCFTVRNTAYLRHAFLPHRFGRQAESGQRAIRRRKSSRIISASRGVNSRSPMSACRTSPDRQRARMMPLWLWLSLPSRRWPTSWAMIFARMGIQGVSSALANLSTRSRKTYALVG